MSACSAPQTKAAAGTKAALATMLVLGNLFFFGCVAGRFGLTPADWSRPAAPEPARILLALD